MVGWTAEDTGHVDCLSNPCRKASLRIYPSLFFQQSSSPKVSNEGGLGMKGQTSDNSSAQWAADVSNSSEVEVRATEV